MPKSKRFCHYADGETQWWIECSSIAKIADFGLSTIHGIEGSVSHTIYDDLSKLASELSSVKFTTENIIERDDWKLLRRQLLSGQFGADAALRHEFFGSFRVKPETFFAGASLPQQTSVVRALSPVRIATSLHLQTPQTRKTKQIARTDDSPTEDSSGEENFAPLNTTRAKTPLARNVKKMASTPLSVSAKITPVSTPASTPRRSTRRQTLSEQFKNLSLNSE